MPSSSAYSRTHVRKRGDLVTDNFCYTKFPRPRLRNLKFLPAFESPRKLPRSFLLFRPHFVRRKRGDSNITCSVHLTDILFRSSHNLSRKVFKSPTKALPELSLFSQNIFTFVHYFAEEGGFEPPIGFPQCQFSKLVPSTSQPLFLMSSSERLRGFRVHPPRFARIKLCPTQFYPLSHSSILSNILSASLQELSTFWIYY